MKLKWRQFNSVCFITITLLLHSSAQTITASEDCMDSENIATLQGTCRSLWYRICETYRIMPGQRCFVETFSDAQITWYSNSIETVYWPYVEMAESGSSDGDTNPDPSVWTLVRRSSQTCSEESTFPETYESGMRLMARD